MKSIIYIPVDESTSLLFGYNFCLMLIPAGMSDKAVIAKVKSDASIQENMIVVIKRDKKYSVYGKKENLIEIIGCSTLEFPTKLGESKIIESKDIPKEILEAIVSKGGYAKPLGGTQKPKQPMQTQSTLGKVVSYSAAYAIVAVNMIGNGILISRLGPDEEAAVGIIVSLYGLIGGAAAGALQSCGIQVSGELGKEDAVGVDIESHNGKIGAIIRTGWISGAVLSLISGGCYLSTKLYMPNIVGDAVGGKVGDFCMIFSISSCETLAITNLTLATQIEKNIWIPVLSSALYRFPALGLGYLFSNSLGMGIKGVALGITVSAVANSALLQLWFSRKPYKKYKLYHGHLKDLKEIPSFSKNAWKLALQRVTEWANLMGITMIIGAWDERSLQALQPALQANMLISTAELGAGTIIMISLSQDLARQKEHYKKFKDSLSEDELEAFHMLASNNKYTFLKNNAAVVLFAGGIAGIIYLCRSPIINLYLGNIDNISSASLVSSTSSVSSEQYDLAETILWQVLVGTIPDAVRIVSGSILRGWDDLLFPTFTSLLLMTFVGVSAAAGISYEENKNPLPFFWIRIIMVALSAIVNCYRFFQHIRADEKLYVDGKDLLAVFNALKNWSSSTNLPLGLRLQAIAGDGHCLYRAVTYYLTHNENIDHLRDLVATELEENIEKYRGFIPLERDRTLERYIKDIKGTNAWAGDLEINILMRVLGRPIVVIGSEGAVRNHDEVIQYAGEPIFVYYDDSKPEVAHYDALICMEGYDSRDILIQMLRRSAHVQSETMAQVTLAQPILHNETPGSNIFSIVATQLGAEYSEEGLRKLTAESIAKKMLVYTGRFGGNKKILLAILEKPGDISNSIIINALSEVIKTNIVVNNLSLSTEGEHAFTIALSYIGSTNTYHMMEYKPTVAVVSISTPAISYGTLMSQSGVFSPKGLTQNKCYNFSCGGSKPPNPRNFRQIFNSLLI